MKAVIAKSFARIHMDNLINNGILPVTFADAKDYDGIELGDTLKLTGLKDGIPEKDVLTVQNVTKGTAFDVRLAASARQRQMLVAGGLLNYTRDRA